MSERKEKAVDTSRSSSPTISRGVECLIVATFLGVPRKILSMESQIPVGVPGITPEEQQYWRNITSLSEALFNWVTKEPGDNNG